MLQAGKGDCHKRDHFGRNFGGEQPDRRSAVIELHRKGFETGGNRREKKGRLRGAGAEPLGSKPGRHTEET